MSIHVAMQNKKVLVLTCGINILNPRFLFKTVDPSSYIHVMPLNHSKVEDLNVF